MAHLPPRPAGMCAAPQAWAVLPAVVQRIPPPQGDPSGDLRMLLFDAYHDEYRGVVCLVEVLDGRVQKGDKITAASTGGCSVGMPAHLWWCVCAVGGRALSFNGLQSVPAVFSAVLMCRHQL